MLMRRDVERITADRARRWGLEARERARPARGRPSRAYPRRPPVTQGEATARSRREQPAGAEASHDATKPWPAVDDVGKAGPGRRRRPNGAPRPIPAPAGPVPPATDPAPRAGWRPGGRCLAPPPQIPHGPGTRRTEA